MTLKLNGSTSGYVTIDAPAVAGTTAITLPAVSGGSFVVSDSSGNVGIGTNTPATKLDVAGGGIMMRVGTSAGGNNLIQAYTDVSALGMWAGGAPRFYSTGGMRFSVNSTVGTSNPTGYTDAMTLDSSGNCGIGTTAPGSRLQVSSSVAGYTTSLADSVTAATLLLKTNSGDSTLTSFGGLSTGAASIQRSNSSGTTAYDVAINPFGGNLLVGTSDSANTTGTGIKLLPNGDGAGWSRISCVTSSSSNAQNVTYSFYSTGAAAYRFYVGAGGTVYATSTTITAISDQRLKENIQDIDVGLDAVMALKPRKFDWKDGKGKDKKGDRGWIAQEFEQVFPDMIDEWKDPAPEGEEPYKAVNADLIPVLVKAIQEQQTVIEDLKSRIAVLESK